jgi:hypothetical protein
MRADLAAQFVKEEFGCELEPETQRLIAKLRSAPSVQHSGPKAASTEEPRTIGPAVVQPSPRSAELPNGALAARPASP